MPNNNKYIPFNKSSIHLFENGFTFFTYSKTEFIPITENISDLKSSLQELFSFYPKGTFSKTQIITYHQPSTFVPVRFFDKNLLPKYLQLLGNFDKDSALNFDMVEKENQVNVYTYPKAILKILNQNLEK
jgi:hypothetical protein